MKTIHLNLNQKLPSLELQQTISSALSLPPGAANDLGTLSQALIHFPETVKLEIVIGKNPVNYAALLEAIELARQENPRLLVIVIQSHP